jgi:purine-binding chemotaxis protein CheW
MSTSTTQQIVVFFLGTDEYALPIARVQEIIRYTEPRAVGSADTWISGVISLRGKIVPVCDVASRLGIVSNETSTANIVIVEAGGATAGIVVDSVDQVLTIGEDQLAPVPTSGSDAIEHIIKLDDRLVVLLNPDAIFGAADLAALAAA